MKIKTSLVPNVTMLVSGCSFTSGWPMENTLGHRNFAWPRLVADHFDYNLIDKSRSASSNYRIYRKAVDGLLDDNVDFVIVFLSEWTRLETGVNFGDNPGRIHQHLTGRDREIFEKFFNGYKNYADSLRMIISMQSLSKQYKKPLYLLDTFSENIHRNISHDHFVQILRFNDIVFDSMNDEYINNKFNKVKNLEKHIDWDVFIHNKSYQELIGGGSSKLPFSESKYFVKGHPNEDGHKKISNIVINFLENI